MKSVSSSILCEKSCRHCPYSHERCQRGQQRFEKPEYLRYSGHDSTHTSCIVVFFSGGKDSVMTLRTVLDKYSASSMIVLLTTYDPALGMNGIQRVPIDSIKLFSKNQRLDLVAIPISPESLPYPDMIRSGLELVKARHQLLESLTLFFGDIHLEHVRQWREEEFSNQMGYTCQFPLWKQDYKFLYRLLQQTREELGVRFIFTAVYDEDLKKLFSPGMPYDEQAIERIAGCDGNKDVFGENGEFQTSLTWDL